MAFGRYVGESEWRIHQGDDVALEVVWKTGATVATATAVDVTGYEARLQVREYSYSTETLVDVDSDDGHITVGTTDGTFTIEFSNAETAAWTWREGVFDLEAVAPDGTVTKIWRGTMRVISEVTR